MAAGSTTILVTIKHVRQPGKSIEHGGEFRTKTLEGDFVRHDHRQVLVAALDAQIVLGPRLSWLSTGTRLSQSSELTLASKRTPQIVWISASWEASGCKVAGGERHAPFLGRKSEPIIGRNLHPRALGVA